MLDLFVQPYKHRASILLAVLFAVIASVVAVLYASTPVLADDAGSCIVISDDRNTATYYPGQPGCQSGSGVKLNRLHSTMLAETEYAFSSSNAVDESCMGIETVALGQKTNMYCARYIQDSATATIYAGSDSGEYSVYSTAVAQAGSAGNNGASAVDPTELAVQTTISTIADAFCAPANSPGAMEHAAAQCAATRQNVEKCEDHIRRLVEAGGGQTLIDDNGLLTCLRRELSTTEQNIRDKLADATTTTPVQPADDPASMSCSIEGVGWIICPTMIFLSNIFDGALSYISTQFLRVESDLTGDTTREYWGIFVNIANVLFILLFLVVVFSQITGFGINNYGIKKILPKLVVSAILINASFFICQIFIDLSNIIGFSISDFLKVTVAESIAEGSGATSGTTSISPAQGITMVVIGGAAAAVALYVALPMLGTAIVVGLVAIISVVFILIARKALIVLLVVISPLAFLALILPNTEKLFHKWRSLMTSLLLLFPIISLLYGGSAVAAYIIQGPNTPGNPAGIMEQITALVVMSVPLFATYPLLKGALNATGKIGATINSIGSKAQGAAKDKAENSRIGEAQRHMKYQRNAAKARRRAGRGFLAERSKRGGILGGIAKVADSPGRLSRAMDRSMIGRSLGLDKGADAAAVAVDEIFEKDVKAAGLTLAGSTHGELLTMIQGGKDKNGAPLSDAKLTAAIDSVMATGGFSDRRAVIEHIAGLPASNKTLKQRVTKAAYAKGDQGVYGVKFGDKIIDGTIDSADKLTAEAVENAAGGNLQAEHLVSSASSTKWLKDAIERSSSPKQSQALSNFTSAAQIATQSSHTAAKINDEISKVFHSVGVGAVKQSAPVAITEDQLRGLTPEQTKDAVARAMNGPTQTPAATPDSTSGSQGASSQEDRVFVVNRSGETTQQASRPSTEPPSTPRDDATAEDTNR